MTGKHPCGSLFLRTTARQHVEPCDYAQLASRHLCEARPTLKLSGAFATLHAVSAFTKYIRALPTH